VLSVGLGCLISRLLISCLCVDWLLLLVDDGLGRRLLLLLDDDGAAHRHDGWRAARVHLTSFLRDGTAGAAPRDAAVIATILCQTVSGPQRCSLPRMDEATAGELQADVIQTAVRSTRGAVQTLHVQTVLDAGTTTAQAAGTAVAQTTAETLSPRLLLSHRHLGGKVECGGEGGMQERMRGL